MKDFLKTKEYLNNILDSMSNGIITIDTDDVIVFFNRKAEKLFNLSEDDVLGEKFYHAIADESFTSMLKNVCRATLEKSRVCNAEVKLSFGEKDCINLRLNTSIIFGDDGQNNGILLVLQEVNEDRSTATLEKLNQLKAQFVSSVSHELRTPLASIKAYTEMLLDGDVDDSDIQREYLSIINEESDRLARLISDLLNLSRLETGRVQIQKKRLDFLDELGKNLSLISFQAESNGIEIVTELPLNLVTIMGDPELITQVIYNILSNAVKYSVSGGKVTVRISQDEQTLCFEVADNGVGIPGNEIPRIFEKFYRIDNSLTRKVGGTGLGLSIVKHVVDAHNGTIEVESTEGKGSSFRVFLPNG